MKAMHPEILRRTPSTPLSFIGRQHFQEAKIFERLPSQKGLASLSFDVCKQKDDSLLTEILKNKIFSFRDALNLPSHDKYYTLHKILLQTLEDLQKLYPKCMSCICISEDDQRSIHETLLHLYKALKFVEDYWSEKCIQSEKFKFEEADLKNSSFEQLGQEVLKRLDCMSLEGKEMFDLIEKGSINISMSERGQGKLCFSNHLLAPTSIHPQITTESNSSPKEFSNAACLPPLLHPLRLEAVEKLKPLDVKHPSFHMLPHHAKMIGNDLDLDSPVTPRNMESFSYTEMGNATTPISMPTTTHLSMNSALVMNEPKHSEENNGNKTSETTTPISKTLPFLHLKASLVSPTPAPPPSPMILTRIPMFFRSLSHEWMEVEPITYAMTIDDNDQVDSQKPLEATIFITQPSSISEPSSIKLIEETTTPAPPISSIEGTIQLSPSPTPYNICALSPSQVPQPKNFASLATPVPPPPPVASSTPSLPLPSLKGSTPTPPPLGVTKAGSMPPSPPLLDATMVGSTPPPPPPPLCATKGGFVPPPPPPSLGAAKALRPRNNTKLKRSSQMGNLYRLLKGKVEGSSLNGKTSNGRTNQVGSGSSGSKAQGMADALAEMVKRSSYFQQIEEDVEKFATSILETQSAINSFKTKDMNELLKFHQHVDHRLEKLTDETQVLGKFEGFPTKKLENIRTAAALHTKLDAMVTTLKEWKLASPISQQIDKVESYFNKIKEEMDVIERTKEEESKRFQSHNIDFDFGILVRIKESMVDLSSNCIEMTLKEAKEAKEAIGKAKSKHSGLSKMLWRAFQLAFRVYNFAGGQDDRADKLTSELANEIETCPCK